MVHFVDLLDEKTLSDIQTIFQHKVEDKPYTSNCMESWLKSKSVDVRINMNNKSESSKMILDIAKKVFDKAGLTINENNGYITYSSYIFNNIKYNKDNYDYVYSSNSIQEEYTSVHECVIIVKKGENIKGGNLEIYDKHPNTFSRIFGLDNSEPNKEVFNLDSGMIFACDGSTFHQFLNCGGSGQYDIITITLYSYKRSGYQYDNDDD